MKPNNNKEQQKIILVGALFVAMLAVLGYNLFGTQGSAAPAPAPGAPGSNPGATAGGAPAPGSSPAPGASPAGPIIDFSTIPLVTTGRDPFVPAGAATQAPTPTPRPPAANPNPYLNTHGLPPGGELAKGLNPGGGSMRDAVLGSGPAAAPEKVEPVQLPPPAPPAYVVTGVVLGDKGGRDVAILRGSGSVGQEDRKFVTVGEDVGNGFYVAAIRADGILLKSRLNATQSPVNISLGKSE